MLVAALSGPRALKKKPPDGRLLLLQNSQLSANRRFLGIRPKGRKLCSVLVEVAVNIGCSTTGRNQISVLTQRADFWRAIFFLHLKSLFMNARGKSIRPCDACQDFFIAG